MSLLRAFERDLDRGPQPKVRIRPLYQILAEEAREYRDVMKSGGEMVAHLNQKVSGLVQLIDGIREQLESLQNANYIAKFPFRYQPARLVNPIEQIQAFYEAITSEKDRELIEGPTRTAEVVKYRTQIMRRLLDFGASGPTIAKILKKDWGTIYYHTLPSVMAKRRKAGMRRYAKSKNTTKKGNHESKQPTAR